MTKKEFIILFFVTFVVIMAWIIFDILHTRANVQITPKLEQARQPLNPNFDLSTLKKIKISKEAKPSPSATESGSETNP